MSIFLVIMFFMILFSPGIIIAAAPASWLRLTASLIVLAVGMLWLDEHVATVAPYDDDGPFYGIGRGIVVIMAIAAGAGVMLRGYALLQDDPDQPRHPIDRAWPLPLGFLAAAFFLHWLSNRLAGSQPAWDLHVQLIALGSVSAALFGFTASRWPRTRSAAILVTAFASSFAAMVANDAAKGEELWRAAKQKAGGLPHCIMTYGGWEHRRLANDGWDLSPLVNRHYGTWAAGKSPVLIQNGADGPQQWRWHHGEFRDGGLGDAPCGPVRPPAASQAGPKSRPWPW